MKKILIFHPYLAPYRIDLYNSLAKHFDLNVLLTGNNKEINSLGFNLNEINNQAQFPYSYYHKGVYVGRHLISSIYYKTINSFCPDLIIAHELGFNTLFAILFKPFFHYKIFVTVDDSPAMVQTRSRIKYYLQRFIVRHVNTMLVTNPTVKEFLEQKHPASSCHFFYLPIIQNEEIFQKKIEETECEIDYLTKNYELKGKKIILFVGRLEEVKCPEMIVTAFHRLNDPNSILVVVGEGSIKNRILAYIDKYHLKSKIILTGKLTGTKLYAWYKIAHIFVLPSKFEPFGAVVNEALIAGCEVLVSDKVGANCLMDNTNGIIFKSGNEQHLMKNLQSMLDNLTDLSYVNKKNKMNITFSELTTSLINLINNYDN